MIFGLGASCPAVIQLGFRDQKTSIGETSSKQRSRVHGVVYGRDLLKVILCYIFFLCNIIYIYNIYIFIFRG